MTKLFSKKWLIGATPLLLGLVLAQGQTVDYAKFALKHTLAGHAGEVYASTLSKDGKLAVTSGSDAKAILWNVATGQPNRTLQMPSAGVLALSPDGKTLATSSGLKTTLWNTATGQPIRTLVHPESKDAQGLESLHFDGDGRRLLTQVDVEPQATLWEVSSGRKLRTFTVGISHAITADGKSLATNDSEGIVFWELSSGKKTKTLRIPITVLGFGLSPDGRTVATSSLDLSANEKTVQLWQISNGKLLRTLKGFTRLISQISFSPNGRSLAANSFNTVKVWDVSSGKVGKSLVTDMARGLVFAPDNKTLLAGSSLWDSVSSKKVKSFNGHTYAVDSVAFLADGLATTTAKETKFWNPETGALVRTLVAKGTANNQIAFSPNGKIYAVFANIDNQRQVQLREVSSGKVLRGIPLDIQELELSLRFTPKGDRLVVRSNKVLEIYGVSNGQIDSIYRQENTSYQYSADESKLAILAIKRDIFGDTARVDVYDLANGGEPKAFAAKADAVLALSPDGNTLAIGDGSGEVRLWETSSGKETGSFKGNFGKVKSLLFAPDGKTLAVNADRGSLWETSSKTEIKDLGVVNDIQFSVDGTQIATGAMDTARIYR